MWRYVLEPVLTFAFLSPVFFAGMYYNILPRENRYLVNLAGTYYFLLVLFLVVFAFALTGVVLSVISIAARISALSGRPRRGVLGVLRGLAGVALRFLVLVVSVFALVWVAMLIFHAAVGLLGIIL